MSFHSPWQSASYVQSIALIRSVLRPFGNLENRFIEYLTERQNQRVRRHLAGSPARSALLIMPRCLKQTHCRVDVQASMDQCRDCVLCPLGDIARLCERFGVRALVAFRSHIAFDLARRECPDLIIATACHDRLIKALRSVPEFPALLTPLSGMEKQCVNASIDLAWLEEQLAAATPTPTQSPVAAGAIPVGSTTCMCKGPPSGPHTAGNP